MLPAVIFALNIPRRRKLQLPHWLFPRNVANPVNVLYAVIYAIMAAIIVSLDTIIWLCIVFALAGPLLLSGFYEAWIDKRVVEFAFERIGSSNMTISLRVRILVAVLIGNLDQDTAWNPAMSVPATLEHHQPLPEGQYARIQEIQRRDSLMHDVQTRLKSMIACQYSFGSAVGAPVVFYIGSFIYAIIETNSDLGDNDTSHALAFGMWLVFCSLMSHFLKSRGVSYLHLRTSTKPLRIHTESIICWKKAYKVSAGG